MVSSVLLVRGPGRARDEAAAAVARLVAVGRLAPEPGAFMVDVGDQMLGAIIGLADPVGAEGIGRNDIRPGRQIDLADRGHDVGPRQRENVVVALLVVARSEEQTSELQPLLPISYSELC